MVTAKNPANERIGAIGWIAMAILLMVSVYLIFIFMRDGADNPEKRCDPRDMGGNPVNLQKAAENGVSVTTKANCYTQPVQK